MDSKKTLVWMIVLVLSMDALAQMMVTSPVAKSNETRASVKLQPKAIEAVREEPLSENNTTIIKTSSTTANALAGRNNRRVIKFRQTKLKNRTQTVKTGLVSVDAARIVGVRHLTNDTILARAFNQSIQKLNENTRRRILNAQNPRLTRNVVAAVALRQKAKQIRLKPSPAPWGIIKKVILENNTKYQPIVERLDAKNPQFMERLRVVAENWTAEEQQQGKKRIISYLRNKQLREKPRVAQIIRNRKLNPNRIRLLLAQNKTIEEITDHIEQESSE